MQGVQLGSGNTQNNFFSIILATLTLTIPGLILSLAGLSFALVSFGGWMSIIFRGMFSGGATLFGPTLPSGYPLAACYFIGFGGGGVIAAVGRSMTRSADASVGHRVGAFVSYSVVAAAIIGATVLAINHVAAGTPYSKLLPHFASCPGEVQNSDSYPSSENSKTTIDQWVCQAKPPIHRKKVHKTAKGSQGSASRGAAGNGESKANNGPQSFENQQVQATAHVTLSRSTAGVGESVTVSGTHFWPNETVNITISAILIEQIKASSRGSFRAAVIIPQDAPPPDFGTSINAAGQTSAKWAEAPFHT